MGVEPFRKVAEGLCGHDGAGFGVRLGDRGPDDGPEGLPAAAAQVGQEAAVPQKQAAQDLRYAQHEVR